MPPYLPIRALNRSQRVRIGGQLISPNTTAYVDLGNLASPLLPVATTTATGEVGPGLTKKVSFFYKVTAVDTSGKETTPSPEVTVTTGEGTNATGAHHNANTISWLPVPNAKEYKVYRGTEAQKEVLLTVTVNRSFTDTGAISAGTATPPVSNTTYVPNKSNQSTKKDLQSHSSIGSYEVVGSLTNSNSDWVVSSGATTTVSELEVTVAAGELRQRSTGLYQTVAGGKTALSAASSTQDRTDLIWVNTTTGAQGHTSGAAAAVGTSLPPAAPEETIPVAAYLVAKEATSAVLVADLRPRA